MIFFNALTGDTNNWETVIGPRLREAGHGTLAYNLRGQTNSKFSPGLKLDVDLIVNDAIGLLEEIKPPRPIMVGLGYFFQLDVAWGELMAYLSLIAVPVLVLYLMLQRAFIASIASTGVKG